MDVDTEPVGVETDGVLDPGEAVERVERGLGVEDHAPLGVDARASRRQQVVDIFIAPALCRDVRLFDAQATQHNEKNERSQVHQSIPAYGKGTDRNRDRVRHRMNQHSACLSHEFEKSG